MRQIVLMSSLRPSNENVLYVVCCRKYNPAGAHYLPPPMILTSMSHMASSSFTSTLHIPDPMPVLVSVHTGHTLQCTLCIHCSASSVAPVQLYTGLLSAHQCSVHQLYTGHQCTLCNPVYSFTGATLGPLQCMHSVHCQCTSSVYTNYTGIWSGWLNITKFLFATVDYAYPQILEYSHI